MFFQIKGGGGSYLFSGACLTYCAKTLDDSTGMALTSLVTGSDFPLGNDILCFSFFPSFCFFLIYSTGTLVWSHWWAQSSPGTG